MTGASKGSASISAGAIVFNAPADFEGYYEIGYRITDTNWNIYFLGTVKVYASSAVVIDDDSDDSPVTPGNTTVPKPKIKLNIWYLIGVAFVLIFGFLFLVVSSRKKKRKS